MLYKIVVDSQIRLFDCKEALTLEALKAFVEKTFPKLGPCSFYYIDEDEDQIMLESKEDVDVFLDYGQKKPKIYVRQT